MPPFLLWEVLPGFDQLQIALKLTDQLAFTEEGFLRWLNKVGRTGDPPLTQAPVTVARTADGVEESFRYRIEWWSGSKRD